MRSGDLRSHEGHGSVDEFERQGNCVFAGVRIPALARTQFIAMENFYFTARALGLGPHATLAELKQAGTQFCAKSWSQLHEENVRQIPDQFILRYCFGAAYVYVLLHDRLGVRDGSNAVVFTNSIKRRKRRRSLLDFQHHDALVNDHRADLDLASHHAAGQDVDAMTHIRGLEATKVKARRRTDEDGVDVSLSWVVGAVLLDILTQGKRVSSGHVIRWWHSCSAPKGTRWFMNDASLLVAMLLPALCLLTLMILYFVSRRGSRGTRKGGNAMSAQGGLSKWSKVSRSLPGLRKDSTTQFSVLIDASPGATG